MKRSIARKWAKALDSGDYKQGTGRLRANGDKFCCLGVLCNIHAQDNPEVVQAEKNKYEYLGEVGCLPAEVRDWSGIQSNNGNIKPIRTSLVKLNDITKLTFPEIAKVIRKHWKEL